MERITIKASPFPKEQLPLIYELLERYENDKRVVIFKSREEMNSWIG